MELRILINDCRKQFAGVSRDNLCYLQDGIQYQFPYLVRDGQLESISGGLVEEFPQRFVCFKPPYRTEDVVLHHGQRKACNLCGEVHGLTLSEIEQHLLIAKELMRSFT